MLYGPCAGAGLLVNKYEHSSTFRCMVLKLTMLITAWEHLGISKIHREGGGHPAVTSMDLG